MFLVELLGKSLQILSLEDRGDGREGSSTGKAAAEKTVGGKLLQEQLLELDPQLRVWAREPPPATAGRNATLET